MPHTSAPENPRSRRFCQRKQALQTKGTLLSETRAEGWAAGPLSAGVPAPGARPALLQGDSSSGASPRRVGHCLHCYLPREGEPWPVDPSPPCTSCWPDPSSCLSSRRPVWKGLSAQLTGMVKKLRDGQMDQLQDPWFEHHPWNRETCEASASRAPPGGPRSSRGTWPAADPAQGCGGIMATGPAPRSPMMPA